MRGYTTLGQTWKDEAKEITFKLLITFVAVPIAYTTNHHSVVSGLLVIGMIGVAIWCRQTHRAVPI